MSEGILKRFIYNGFYRRNMRDIVCGMEAKDEFKVKHLNKIHSFCSQECLNSFLENPAKYLKKDKVKTGVKVFDVALPFGIPRDSFVLISGEGGTGKSIILQELLYKRLRKNKREKGIFVCLDDIPTSIIQDMQNFGWKIAPFLEDRLKFLDCYSFRLKPEKIPHCVVFVKDPSDITTFTSTLDYTMKEMDMYGNGIVVFDSLTEFMTLSDATKLIEAIKTWRARGPKEYNITFLASIHYGSKVFEDAISVLDYIMDGL
ncbi:MAG: ATPase domain-containing protein, partial [Candidatus Methanofastidiosia archaeon]